LDPEAQAEGGGDGSSSSDEEFSGKVITPDEESTAVESVDFSDAVDDGKADVGTVVRDSRIQEVLDELDSEFVGLKKVKQRIREIAALLVIDRLRSEMGLSTEAPTLHMSFTGSPGTGKTTVALRIAAILHRLGYIEKGQLIAVTRDDLVGQYVGHTAPKTKEAVNKSLGGVLFIDEAYYLHRPENERDYGQEAIEVLLSAMETHRDEFVVVMAGYKEPMNDFFLANPGMGSRIAHHIDFPDYTPEELMQIADMMFERQTYQLSDDAREAFLEYIERRVEQPRFAHGRSIRNAIDRARMRQAMRLFDSESELTKDDLVTIEAEDIRQSSVFTDTEEEAPDEKAEEAPDENPEEAPDEKAAEAAGDRS
jgi:probable Rubsico expression protein CbbX